MKQYFKLIITGLLFFGFYSCGEDEEEPEISIGNCNQFEVAKNNPLSEIKYFAYQIQDISDEDRLNELVNSKYDLVVLEPTRTDVTGDSDFDTKAAVTKIKSSKGHNGLTRKKVIAYIDIGEVEDWRWYWTWSKVEWRAGTVRPSDWPDYIVKPDPDGWSGNYPVAYWDARWKDIVIYGKNTTNSFGDYNSVLDEVVSDGFDGVYLDWVEGFEDADIEALAIKQGKNAAKEMVQFIKEIREYGKSKNPGFIVIQQNAAELISKESTIVNYIDGLSQEGVWYDGFGGFDDWDDTEGYDVLNETDLTNYYLTNLQKYMEKGIPVWCVEYALSNADEAYRLAAENCMIPYCTRRSLAKITTTHPPGY